MMTGSCLCGGIRYEIQGEGRLLGHCHCSMCRKEHGAAYGTYLRVRRDDFKLAAGKDLVRSYRSSPGVARTFCGRCGSTLQFVPDDGPHFGVAAGTLDDDPGVRPSYRIWLGSRAPWDEVPDDGLFHHQEEP